MDAHRLPILRVYSTLLNMLLMYSVAWSFIIFLHVTMQAKNYLHYGKYYKFLFIGHKKLKPLNCLKFQIRYQKI